MIALKYSLFAAFSICINLLFQFLSFAVYSGRGSIYLAMFSGTLAGLVVKYILDKKYIFYHVVKDKQDDAQKFALYTFMGLGTTLLFWGTEVFFDFFFDHENAKYLGAVIGLVMGYSVKYFLDKRFVFTELKT